MWLRLGLHKDRDQINKLDVVWHGNILDFNIAKVFRKRLYSCTTMLRKRKKIGNKILSSYSLPLQLFCFVLFVCVLCVLTFIVFPSEREGKRIKKLFFSCLWSLTVEHSTLNAYRKPKYFLCSYQRQVRLPLVLCHSCSEYAWLRAARPKVSNTVIVPCKEYMAQYRMQFLSFCLFCFKWREYEMQSRSWLLTFSQDDWYCFKQALCGWGLVWNLTQPDWEKCPSMPQKHDQQLC